MSSLDEQNNRTTRCASSDHVARDDLDEKPGGRRAKAAESREDVHDILQAYKTPMNSQRARGATPGNIQRRSLWRFSTSVGGLASQDKKKRQRPSTAKVHCTVSLRSARQRERNVKLAGTQQTSVWYNGDIKKSPRLTGSTECLNLYLSISDRRLLTSGTDEFVRKQKGRKK